MKTFLVSGLMLSILMLDISAVDGLKCYACSTTKDWSKCDDIKKEVTCPSSYNKCLKAEIHTDGGGASEDAYIKMCAQADSCSASTLSKCNTKVSGVKIDCKVSCCEGNLCNTAAVNVVSGSILLACAVLALFRNF